MQKQETPLPSSETTSSIIYPNQSETDLHQDIQSTLTQVDLGSEQTKDPSVVVTKHNTIPPTQHSISDAITQETNPLKPKEPVDETKLALSEFWDSIFDLFRRPLVGGSLARISEHSSDSWAGMKEDRLKQIYEEDGTKEVIKK